MSSLCWCCKHGKDRHGPCLYGTCCLVPHCPVRLSLPLLMNKKATAWLLTEPACYVPKGRHWELLSEPHATLGHPEASEKPCVRRVFPMFIPHCHIQVSESQSKIHGGPLSPGGSASSLALQAARARAQSSHTPIQATWYQPGGATLSPQPSVQAWVP